MKTTLWQEDTTQQLKEKFKKNDDSILFAVFGSTSSKENYLDFWSDIDGLLVLKDEAFEKYSNNIGWIEFIGNIFTYQHQPGEHSQTYRIVFDDFKKLDLVLIKESVIDAVLQPNVGPYWKEVTILFSKSTELEQKLKNTKKDFPSAPHFTDKQFIELVNNFWFNAQLALYKTVRNDLLIAQHLTLELYKDALLLGMIIRDRETGTNIHKHGGIGNDLIKTMTLPLKEINQINIINLIDNCGKEFDQLCIKWNKDFSTKHQVFIQFIEKAKKELQ
jgi:hypothetical protein